MRLPCTVALLLLTGTSRAQLIYHEGQPGWKRDHETFTWTTFSTTPPQITAIPGIRMWRSLTTANENGADGGRIETNNELAFYNAQGRPDTCLRWSGSWVPYSPVSMTVYRYNSDGNLSERRNYRNVDLLQLLPHPVVDTVATAKVREEAYIPVGTLYDPALEIPFSNIKRYRDDAYVPGVEVIFERSLISYEHGRASAMRVDAITNVVPSPYKDGGLAAFGGNKVSAGLPLLKRQIRFEYAGDKLAVTTEINTSTIYGEADSIRQAAFYDNRGRMVAFSTRKWPLDRYPADPDWPVKVNNYASDSLSIRYREREIETAFYGYTDTAGRQGAQLLPDHRFWHSLDRHGRIVQWEYADNLQQTGQGSSMNRQTVSRTRYSRGGRCMTTRKRTNEATRYKGPFSTRRACFDEAGRLISSETGEGHWKSKTRWWWE